ncbi:MAG: [protein-PII] uridylyltransferase [Gemmatimonadota bacterium]
MPAPLLDAEIARPDLPDREFLDRLRSFLAGTLASAREGQRGALAGGARACRDYSRAMDAALSAIYGRARARFLATAPDLAYRMAAVAVGGYGREELCPRSDVDLLFIHPYKVDPYVEAMTERILYPLWDLGLEVGHSVRSVKETIRMAAADDSVRTALMDFRFVAGDAAFFAEAAREIERFLFFAGADRFIDAKVAEMRSRHAKFGETVYVLEPNVKEGKGGLRDLHTAVWAARIKYKCRTLAEIRTKGVIGAKTEQGFHHVRDYLLRVRNELHFLVGKKADVLTFELQESLAAEFGYRTRGRDLGVERFMKSYYMHAATAVHLAEELLEEVSRFLPDGTRRPLFAFRKKAVGGGGVLYKGKLGPSQGVSFASEPIRILEFFRALQRTRSVMSAAAKKAIQRALPAIGPEFRQDPAAARLFLEILGDPHRLQETLTAMHECRFLGRYLPEFAALSFKVQRDIYHVYTVDIHLIIAASVFANLVAAASRTAEEDAFLALYRAVPRKDLFTLAVLLHDIGKGRGHGHSKIGAEIVARVGERLGLRPAEIADLVFLVEHHLLMAHTSQRRDLHDIELILSFADTVGGPSRLERLYLLTYADLRAVGPEVWTGWKAMLLAELYEKAKNVLETGELKRPFEERARRRREQVREMLSDFPPDDVSRYLSRFGDRYFLGTPDGRFAAHLRLLGGFDGMTPLVDTVDHPGSGVSEFIIACPDERGLFAKIAGTLSANGVNILNATIATSLDGVALDTFYVNYMGRSLAGDPKRERVVADLAAVLRGEKDVAALVAERAASRFLREKVTKYRPTRVVFDNSASSRYTVVDIFTYDRIGLLYDITRTLAALGIDIGLSKISTKADQVADVFYLADAGGRKILEPGRLDEIRRALLAAIGE